uniref:Uncharacterized protein n=1 Tax=Candidatus Methanogaster sp. ANME-2c ERB4 TaxID=2759911 RepID=A0A7G9YFF9_9EURY|nr:hypothetical protein EIOBDEGA_00031 [Methanosarcinales archaeon ANME-2c ERB4]
MGHKPVPIIRVFEAGSDKPGDKKKRGAQHQLFSNKVHK